MSKKTDIFSSLVILISGLVFIFIIIPRQSSPGEEFGMPPALLPTAMMVLISILALIHLIKSLRIESGDSKKSTAGMSGKNWLHLLIYAVLLFIALAIMKFVGFIFGGIFAVAAFAVLMGLRNPVTIALMSIPPPLIVFVVLRYGLKIPMP